MGVLITGVCVMVDCQKICSELQDEVLFDDCGGSYRSSLLFVEPVFGFLLRVPFCELHIGKYLLNHMWGIKFVGDSVFGKDIYLAEKANERNERNELELKS